MDQVTFSPYVLFHFPCYFPPPLFLCYWHFLCLCSPLLPAFIYLQMMVASHSKNVTYFSLADTRQRRQMSCFHLPEKGKFCTLPWNLVSNLPHHFDHLNLAQRFLQEGGTPKAYSSKFHLLSFLTVQKLGQSWAGRTVKQVKPNLQKALSAAFVQCWPQ